MFDIFWSVSILVFVELALDDISKRSEIGTKRRVSILVFVELALDGLACTGKGRDQLVSILVFVELALDDSQRRLDAGRCSSFNPCFRGTCS